MAAAMLQRLRDDLAQYAQVAQHGSLTELLQLSPADAAAIVSQPDGPAARSARGAVEQLATCLERRIVDDRALLLLGMREAEACANKGSALFGLAQHAHVEASITFEMLVSMLVAAHGDGSLARLN
eukprot:6152863-Prymnesium_polylepis.1